MNNTMDCQISLNYYNRKINYSIVNDVIIEKSKILCMMGVNV